MKQGSGNNVMGGAKREPVPQAIRPAAVAQIGLAQSVRPDTLVEGRGFKAPTNQNETSHPSGSQGKHR